jgi:hypothetical protein
MYLGKEAPQSWKFTLPKKELRAGMRFRVDVIDTWNMTITRVPQVFEIKKLNDYQFGDVHGASVALPGKPYMAIRIERVD